jgi:hypothetical protein
MESLILQVAFEGEGVNPGRVDASAFARAINGYSTLFKRANYLLNGEESTANVYIESEFKEGSFIAFLDFQTIAGSVITAHQFLNASGLSLILGYLWENKDTLFDLLKMLKGHKPESVITQGDYSRITYGDKTQTFHNCVFNLYNDSDAKKALSDITSTLQVPGIDKISIGKSVDNAFALAKSDEIEIDTSIESNVELNDDVDAGEREALLTIGKLDFDEKKNWTFFEQGSTVNAKIIDKEFWSRVHARSILFGEGDQFRVILSWRIERQGGKFRQFNSILKVSEIKKRAQQLLLRTES